MPREKKRRGEKPQWRSRAKEWVARVWEVDGSCSGWTGLGNDKEIALQLYGRWLETGEKPETERGKESFEKAARRIVDAAEKDGEDMKDRRTRLRLYALPRIGMVEVGNLEPKHVASVLDAMVKVDGMSAGSALKMRSDISQVLAQLRREGAIAVNVAREMALPKGARVDARERVSLTDEQILAFQRLRGFATQLDMMCLFSRCVAGHRTSDEHAGTWEHVDLVDFAWMKVRRPKTDGDSGQNARIGRRRVRAYELVTHEVDEQYREHIRAWWVAAGKPTSGPIFPLLRDAVSTPMRLKDGRIVQRQGGKVGERRGKGTSHAEALRRAVWECGIYEPMAGFDPKRPDKALCRLQTDTDESRRLDFQSFRRGLVTALADAGVNAQTSLAITGHTQLSTQLKHYMGKRRVKVPRAALPGGAVEAAAPTLSAEHRAALEALLGLSTRAAPIPEAGAFRDSNPRFGMEPPSHGHPVSAKSLKHLVPPTGFEPVTRALGKHRRAPQVTNRRVITEAVQVLPSPAHGVSSHVLGGNESARDALLAEMARAALREDWAQLDRLRGALSALDGPTRLAPVHKLSDARKR